MIERDDFREHFKYFDREVVVEIIDLFLETYQQQLTDLQKCITALDMEKVNMHAHSLKGLAGTFVDPDAKDIAAAIEEMAKNGEALGMPELFTRLRTSTHQMAGELKEIRDQMYS
jgi:HPt (histidine-containing phosphotransfer) domain-containing protein